MFTEKTVKPPRRWNIGAVIMSLLLLMIGAMPVVRAEEPQTTSQDTQVRRKFELYTRTKGKTIAEGRNTNASEQVPVERYTVEELKLDEPLEVEIRGEKTEVYQAYRITVFGGPFVMRAMPLLLMIDDKTTLVGLLGPKPDKATFILYDGSLLRDGATLAVGYGAGGVELTEKLSLSKKRQ
jgi:hypothetical protein